MRWSEAKKQVGKGNKVSHPSITPKVIVLIEHDHYITFSDGYSCPDGELFKYNKLQYSGEWYIMQ